MRVAPSVLSAVFIVASFVSSAHGRPKPGREGAMPESLLLIPNTGGCKSIMTRGANSLPQSTDVKDAENYLWCWDTHVPNAQQRSILCIIMKDAESKKPGLFAGGYSGNDTHDNLISYNLARNSMDGWSEVFDSDTIVLSSPRELLVIYPPDPDGNRGFIFHADTFIRFKNEGVLSVHKVCTGHATDPGEKMTKILIAEFLRLASPATRKP